MGWVLDTPRTDQEVAVLRESVISEWPAINEFTCDNCRDRHTCKLAFDPYNTDGDCLMEK